MGLQSVKLPARVQEHSDALIDFRYSTVAEQAIQIGHNTVWNNVRTLPSNYAEINLFYSESLLILKRKPSLNKIKAPVHIKFIYLLLYTDLYYV